MKHIYLLFVLIVVFSCEEIGTRGVANRIQSIYGQQIHFTNEDTYFVNGRDTIIKNKLNSKTKILVYADTTSCDECSLRLGEWGVKQRELKLSDFDTDVIFVINSNDYKRFEHYAHETLSNYPFIYDLDGIFKKKNADPLSDVYRTFLLDKYNRIVLVGSPLLNDKLLELYKKEIARLTAQ